MKRTCRKSSQPLKVSWGWLSPTPRRAGWPPLALTHSVPHPRGQAAPRFHPEHPTSRRTMRQGAQPRGHPSPAGPGSTLALSPLRCPAWLRLAPARCCPGPPCSLPGPQDTMGSLSPRLPPLLRGGASREPLRRMDVCVATVGQGFCPLNPQQHRMKRKQGPGARAGRGRQKGPSVLGPGAWFPASSSKGEEPCTEGAGQTHLWCPGDALRVWEPWACWGTTRTWPCGHPRCSRAESWPVLLGLLTAQPSLRQDTNG